MRRLAIKEQEYQDYVNQIAEYKSAQAPGPAALRSALLDPAVNLLIEKLRKELQATKSKLEETQNELQAWKFTPDSNTGKRLMAKCRLLYQENEELGKVTSNGRLAKLESELAMHKSFSDEVKKSQSELEGIIQELDEDVEGMQSTILFLQQELKTTRERIDYLEKENEQIRSGDLLAEKANIEKLDTTDSKLVNGKTDLDFPIKLASIKEEFNGENTENNCNGAAEIESPPITTETTVVVSGKPPRLRKRNYDSDSSDCGAPLVGNNKRIKRKTRRSSILAIEEANEDHENSAISTPHLAIEEQAVAEEKHDKVLTRRKSSRNLGNGVIPSPITSELI